MEWRLDSALSLEQTSEWTGNQTAVVAAGCDAPLWSRFPRSRLSLKQSRPLEVLQRFGEDLPP